MSAPNANDLLKAKYDPSNSYPKEMAYLNNKGLPNNFAVDAERRRRKVINNLWLVSKNLFCVEI